MGKTRIDKDAFMPDDVVIKPSPTPKDGKDKAKKPKKRKKDFYLNKDRERQLIEAEKW